MENRSESVVRVENLSRRFGRKVALDGVSLEVPRGCVFGLVGSNGAGKTTLLRHMLGLLKAQGGRVRVFDRDPVRETVAVLSRIGYLSEERDLPEWMRVDELMRYVQAYRPSWDEAYADELIRNFGLDPSAIVKDLSRGQRAQAGLVAAVAHRPDLLILDEPSSGLDPIVRQDILGAVVRAVADVGKTVVFSSHLLEEVEQLSDHVAMMDGGRIILQGPLDEVIEQHRRIEVLFDTAPASAPRLPGALSMQGTGRAWAAVCNGAIDDFRRAVAESGGRIVGERGATLEEIFVARVGRSAASVEG
jgi:ABC-2 type transport system ATP-binding protein